jgi:alpha-D-xyloside xylohydrolase
MMLEAHEKGTPIIRPLFYEFPQDKMAWEIESQYMYGDKYLCSPVLNPGQFSKKVYFPEGATWKMWDGNETEEGEIYEGGQTVEVDSPMERMPVFIRQ